MFILTVCQALEKANVLYAVVGGYAVALHGAVRGTVDVDIAINWNLENLQNAEKALSGLGLVSRLPINSKNVFDFRQEYIENRNLKAWNFYNPSNPMHQVDLIISYDLTEKNIDRVQIPDGSIKILSKGDLIRMKKESGRPQDIEDINALENL